MPHSKPFLISGLHIKPHKGNVYCYLQKVRKFWNTDQNSSAVPALFWTLIFIKTFKEIRHDSKIRDTHKHTKIKNGGSSKLATQVKQQPFRVPHVCVRLSVDTYVYMYSRGHKWLTAGIFSWSVFSDGSECLYTLKMPTTNMEVKCGKMNTNMS